MTQPVYLFAYFTGNGEQGMRLAVSEDGLLWTDLSPRFLIAPDSGLMRDPFLYLGPDEQFRLIWTTNWESQDIGYASSANLRDWTRQRRLPVMASIPGTRNCWAPEMTYDPASQSYLVFWASTVPGMFAETAGSSETDYNHRMWCVSTQDFQSFSAPKIYFDPGFNVIDVTLLSDPQSGKTRLIGKNETLDPIRKDLFHCVADSVQGPFSPPSAPFTQSWVEGPAALKIGPWTYVYFDEYRSKRYGAVRTQNFQTWENVSDRVRLPTGARHGSIVTVPRDRISAFAR